MRKWFWICVPVALAVGNTGAVEDQPTAPFRLELLETAYGIASAIPLHPHIKDRARCQEQAVAAALQLDQPGLALRFASQIPNWRKGMALADCAFYLAGHGDTNAIPGYLDLADQASRNAQQEWRRERVRARIAQTWRLLGEADKAAGFSIPFEPTEEQTVDAGLALSCSDDGFAGYAEQLDSQIAAGGLDGVKSALYAYADLYGRFYSMTARRSLIEQNIKNSWAKLPVFERLALLETLSTLSLEQGDQPNAVRLVNEMDDLLAASEWPAEYHLQLLARLAKQQQRCGETSAAQKTLENAKEIYAEQKDSIVDIYRAEALIPLAEACAMAGDMKEALNMYFQALEEAAGNPNSRPRAEDLCAVCLSMAVHGIEPTPAFMDELNTKVDGLGEPW